MGFRKIQAEYSEPRLLGQIDRLEQMHQEVILEREVNI